MKELTTFIENELPPEDEWWGNGAEVFKKVAKKLLKEGVSEVVIKEIFMDLYKAVAEEYGE